jgi:hypothetical protein
LQNLLKKAYRTRASYTRQPPAPPHSSLLSARVDLMKIHAQFVIQVSSSFQVDDRIHVFCFHLLWVISPNGGIQCGRHLKKRKCWRLIPHGAKYGERTLRLYHSEIASFHVQNMLYLDAMQGRQSVEHRRGGRGALFRRDMLLTGSQVMLGSDRTGALPP